MNNQKKYNTLRLTFPEMSYESFEYSFSDSGMDMAFNFSVGDKIHFRPTAHIPLRPFMRPPMDHAIIDSLVFHIGMIELVSYWKCLCPPTVRIRQRMLDEGQIAFWKKLYFNGLGEFFYTNGIHATMDDFMQIVSEGTAPCRPLGIRLDDSYMVPVGGGKDSVVTLELLRNAGADIRPLIVNPRGATTECVAKGGFADDDTVVIQRTLDPVMLDLNSKGCLNGHTPFSALLAFYTLLTAALTGRRNIALSNESSANEATVIGTEINHQYSKSLEFENDFRNYVRQYISADFNYFSFLRPLNELQIAMLFSRQEAYFDVFKSCNAGSKQDIWCGRCPKCLFVYTILSPFIPPQRLDAIFGKCMLDDPDMAQYFEQLTGHADTKPFECVGTVSEVNSALAMAIDRWYPQPESRPALLRNYRPQPPATPLHTLLSEHNLSASQLSILADAVRIQ
ncbi:MAG: hypothetical protein J6X62_04130 [Bacteroidales bacterium]|nr:hypothetical protein [Bacteroidales bacterium]